MKIAFIANTDWYLYGYRRNLATQLQRLGHQVVMVCPKGQYHQMLVDSGFSWIPIEVSRKGINPINDLRLFLKLLRINQVQKFDIVHQFTIKPIIYGSFAAKLTGIKQIFNSITGLGFAFTNDEFLVRGIRKIILQLYRAALPDTTVIFQNAENLEKLVSHGVISQQHGIVIPGSGIDIAEFYITPEPPGKPKVLFAGRLIWEKGINEFVQAARSVNQSAHLADFLIAGQSDPDNPSSVPNDEIEKWISEGIVEWLGWQTDMAAVYREASIVCLPSYYGEGLPKVLLEAASSGRPIVAADIPGCRDIVIPHKTGLLVEPRNIEDLKNAIQFLLSNPEVRSRMGRAGRKLVEESFSDEKVIQATLALYFENK